MNGEGRVVLVGAGHAHLHVARCARRFAERGIELVLIDPGCFWYSGLATGMLGGQYGCEEDRVDAARLIERSGGRFVRGRAAGLDTAERVVRLDSGVELGYDALSFNVGSVVGPTPEVEPPEADRPPAGEPADERRVWAVKPISDLCRLRERLEALFAGGHGGGQPARIVVVGGGATGCEIAANVRELASRRGAAAGITLIGASDRLLSEGPKGASGAIAAALRQRDVEIVTPVRIERVEQGDTADGRGAAIAEDGRRFAFDALVLATGLRPPPLFERLGLPTAADGGLRVGPTLQSPHDERVFGAGDCIALRGHDLPRLGVFGVRQAPILLHNLLALLGGGRHGPDARATRLKDYRPQKRWLSILNLGRGEALATWGPLYWRGRRCMRLKDRLDRGFLRKHRV